MYWWNKWFTSSNWNLFRYLCSVWLFSYFCLSFFPQRIKMGNSFCLVWSISSWEPAIELLPNSNLNDVIINYLKYLITNCLETVVRCICFDHVIIAIAQFPPRLSKLRWCQLFEWFHCYNAHYKMLWVQWISPSNKIIYHGSTFWEFDPKFAFNKCKSVSERCDNIIFWVSTTVNEFWT